MEAWWEHDGNVEEDETQKEQVFWSITQSAALGLRLCFRLQELMFFVFFAHKLLLGLCHKAQMSSGSVLGRSGKQNNDTNNKQNLLSVYYVSNTVPKNLK